MADSDSDILNFPAWPSFTKEYHHEPTAFISPLRSENSAAGKNIIVTGGGTGIGKSIAVSFTQAGARSVTILGRREAKLQLALKAMEVAKRQAGTNTAVSYQVADLTKRDTVDAAFAAVKKEFGPVQVLVSNAGALPDMNFLKGSDEAKLMNGFSMNVLTNFNAMQAFFAVMDRDPLVIHISTLGAHSSPIPRMGAYTASKAAGLKVMSYFDAENPELRMVHVQPGIIETEIDPATAGNAQDKVELPGHFSVWLATEQARFLNHKFLWANWDAEELLARKKEIEDSNMLTWLLQGVPI